MRLTRAISALAGVLAIVVASPTAANAQNEYPPPPPALTLSANTIIAGNFVTLIGRNFQPGDPCRITNIHRAIPVGMPAGAGRGDQGAAMVPVAFHMPLADGGASTPPITVTPDATGAFSVRLRFNDPGAEDITATQDASGLSATVTLTVLHTGNLPVTGRNIATISIVGGSVLVAGVALFLLTSLRRRRRGGPGASDSQPGLTS